MKLLDPFSPFAICLVRHHHSLFYRDCRVAYGLDDRKEVEELPTNQRLFEAAF